MPGFLSTSVGTGLALVAAFIPELLGRWELFVNRLEAEGPRAKATADDARSASEQARHVAGEIRDPAPGPTD